MDAQDSDWACRGVSLGATVLAMLATMAAYHVVLGRVAATPEGYAAIAAAYLGLFGVQQALCHLRYTRASYALALAAPLGAVWVVVLAAAIVALLVYMFGTK